MHRETRLAPSSLRHALVLLVPLALLATVLLGLLAQSASAHHDGAPPATSSVVAQAPVGDDTTPTWTVTAPADRTDTSDPTVVAGATTTVTITHEHQTQCLVGSTPASAAAFTAATPTCGPSFTGSATVDGGSTVLSVRTVQTTTRTEQVDVGLGPVAGPSSSSVAYSGVTSAAYRLDLLPPVVSVTGPTGAAYTGWDVAVSDVTATRLTCTLTGPGGTSTLPGSTCNVGQVRPTLGADGTYRLTVVATDEADHTTSVSSSDFSYDGTPPVIVLADLLTDNERTAVWSFTTSGAAGAPTCTLTGPGVTGPGTCTSTGYTSAPLSEAGVHTLTVRATDAAGNTATSTATYELDLTGPGIDIDPAGTTTGPSSSRSWTMTLTGATSSTCDIDGVVLSCAGPLVGTPAGDGPTTLTVAATDAYGNSSSSSATYVRDSTAGLTPGTAPTSPGRSTTPRWTYTVETGSTVSCTLIGPGAAAAGGACTTTGFTAGELPTTPGADYQLTVTVTDPLGNVTSYLLPTYRLDSVAVLTPGAAPETPGRNRTPSWSYTVETGSSVVCALSGPGAAGGSCTSTGFTASTLPPTTGADYALTVTVTDALGNATTYRLADYRLDSIATLTPGTRPSSPGSDRTPDWAFTVEPGSTVSCVLTGPGAGGGSCSTTGFTAATLPASSGADYSLAVTVTDALGNPTTYALAGYRLDSVADLTPGTSPTTPGNDRTPSWAFVVEPGSTVVCALSGPGATGGACSTTGFTANELPTTSGADYLLTVTVTDPLGNATPHVLPGYRLDTTADLVPGAAPGTPGNDVRPAWTFAVDAGSTVSCTLTGPGASGGTCTTTGFTAATLPGSSAADYVLSVAVTDTLGTTTSHTLPGYRLDTIAGLTEGAAPSTPGNDRTPTWAFTVEPGSTVTCALTGPGAAGGACSNTGFTAAALPITSGADYVLTVSVADTLGNVTRYVLPDYRLDTTAGLTVVRPSSPGSSRTPSWEFTAEAGSTVSCSFVGTGSTGGSCTPAGFTANTLPSTSGADYVLTVTVTDALGNATDYVQPAYRLDTVADLTRGAAPSTPGNDRTPTWAFTVEPGSTVTCALAGPGAGGGACSTTGFTAAELPTTSGADYVLTVTVTDGLGNATDHIQPGYRLDTVADLTPGAAPATPGNDRTPTWAFTVEPGSTVTCALSGPGANGGVCSTTSFTASELPTTSGADYVLTVTVTDALGNPTAYTQPGYRLDTVADLTRGATPSTPGSDRTPSWAFTVESGSTVSCALTGPGAGGGACSTTGFTANELPTTSGADYVLTVTVTDGLGNPTAYVLDGYRLDTTADLARGAAPATPSNDRTPTWAFTVEPGSTVTCALAGPGANGGVCSTTGFIAAELPTTSGADYVLTVTVTDALGNPTAYVLDGYRLDTTADLARGAAPATPGNDRTPTWAFTVEPGSTVTCALAGPGANGGVCSTTGFIAAELPTTSGADYVLTVTVTDALGNPTAYVLDGYRLDTTADLARGAAPATPGNDRTPTWAFTVEPGSTVTCALSGPGANGGVCSTTGFTAAELPTTSGADYVLTVTVTDALGNVSTYTQPSYRLDTTADLVEGAGPASPDNDRNPAWAFTVEPGSSVVCTLTGPGVAGGTCTATGFRATTLPTTGGASYDLTVTVTDALGNATEYVLDSYRLDTDAEVSVVPPTSPGNDRTPTWTFVREPGSTVTCVLSGPGAAGGTCSTTGFTAAELPTTSGADYVLTLTATDALGNVTSYTLRYRLDTVADLTPGTAPATPGNDRTPTWAFTVEPGSTVTCALAGPGAGGGVCSTTGFTAAELPTTSGADYVLTVTVTDGLGNPTAYVLDGYRLDTVADLTPGTAPATPGNDRTPTWAFTVEPGSTVSCALTGPGASGGVCSTTGFTAAELPTTSGADYVLTVTVTDGLGNPTDYTQPGYRLDTTADLTRGAAPSTPGNDRTPTWAFTVEPGSTVTCALSGPGAGGGACSTTGFTADELPTTSGADYVLTVTVTDALGNATDHLQPGYRLDTVADLTLDLPSSPGNDRSPGWRFSTEAGATVTCALTGPGASGGVCSTTGFTAAELPTTSGADYVLTVTVTDALGNVTAYTSPAYRLDTVADLTPGTAPVTPGNDRTPTWAFTVEPGSTVTCALTGPGANGGACSTTGFTADELPTTSGADYVLTVRVTDALGNATDYAQPGYRLDTVADLTVTGPASPSNDTTPTWLLTIEPGSSASCTLVGPGAPASGIDCTSGTFTSPPLPATAGADYVLTVTVTDGLGNVTSYVQPVLTLDTVLPVATITVPTSPSRQVGVVWTVDVDEELTSSTCALRRDGVVVAELANCPGSTTVTLAGDGRYDLVVTLVDIAGNSSTTTSAVLVHDATTPTAPALSPVATTSNSTTATWTVTGEEGTAVTTCRVTRGTVVVQDWTVCAGTFSVPLPSDGEYVLEAVSTDPVGPGPVSTATYLLDTVLPVAPTVSGPTGPSQSRTPAWNVVTEVGSSTECRLVRGSTVVTDWAPCGGGFAGALAGLPDGGYVLEARATDTAQNVGPVGSSAPYVLDTTAPVAPVVTGPPGPSQLRAPGFTWTGEAGADAECQLALDGQAVGGWVVCAPGYAPTLDQDGTWTVTVRITDAAGNVSLTATSGGYLLDTTPPDVPVVTPPKTPGRDLAPSWGAVVEGGTTLECRLTGADGRIAEWAACVLPLTTTLSGRPDGTYVLEVRATDAAGNLSAVGTGTYVLDTAAPAAALVTSPAGGRSRTPSFTITTESGATTRCRLTSGATLISDFAACASPVPVDLTALPDGTYTLSVRVVDAAGNPGPAATGTYVLDTTGPAAPVVTLSPASPSPARSIVWAFTFEPGSTLVCRLTFPSGAVREISGCSSPLTVDLTGLPDGSYTLTVRAVDVAGNVGGVLTEVHVLDSAALVTPTVVGPASPGNVRTPRWTIGGTGTECRLSRGSTVLRDWAACSVSFTADLFGQPDGTYVLAVRSRDAGGEVSAATQSRYVLDTTAPGAATVVSPPTPSTNRTPTWTIASSELGATAECRVLLFSSVLRDWAACAVTPAGAPFALDLTSAFDGTYTLVVRLADAAGNRSGVETSSPYQLDTSAPVAVGITGPPRVGNDPRPVWLLSSGAGVLLKCRLTSAAGVVSDWAPCATEFRAELTESPDGVYTLAVRALSAAGTPGPEATSAYELNRSAPSAPTALTLTGGVKGVDSERAPTWTFTVPSGTTAACRVVRGTQVVYDGACTTPTSFRLDLSRAEDGSYTLTVRAVSTAGTAGPAATSTYVLDTVPTAPPALTQVPGATGSSLDPQWRFSVARGASAQCRLLYGATPLDDWASCDRQFTAQLTGRPDGRYVLQVRAVDSADNTSLLVESAYLLDRSAPPVPAFQDVPPATGTARSASWTFHAPGGTNLECRVVNPEGSAGEWVACGAAGTSRSSGVFSLDLASRADGQYFLEVRVAEADGRRGAASRSGYLLDTRLPDMPAFSVPPAATGKDPRPVWVWDLKTDDLVECRLVRVGGSPVEDWQECAASQFEADLSRLADGAYALELRTVDAAGNVGPARSAGYRYDTTAPDEAVLTGRPPAGGADRTVTWTFAPVDGRATCSVTRDRTLVREGPCSGRYELDLTGLPDGLYTLTVRVTDAAGNPSRATTATYSLRAVGLAGPIRVDPPPSRPVEPVVPRDSTPTGPGRGGTGIGGAPSGGGSAAGPVVPIQPEPDVVRASQNPRSPSTPSQPEVAAPQESEPKPAESNPLLPRALPVDDVDDVIRELVTGTATKPTLPLALLAIVILFLLAQNRIDRRDPKLAAAPVEAEPELDFTAIVRRPGGALS